MSKLYNIQNDIVNSIISFFQKIDFKFTKPQLKLLPFIIVGMADSESVVTSDITKSFKSDLFSSIDESNQRRIRRFLNNTHFNIYDFYHSSIKYIIDNLKGIKHPKFVVTMDHMFTRNNFVTLMFTLKVGNQGIPIWFRTEKTKSNIHSEIYHLTKKKLFSEKLIMNAIKDVISLFDKHNIKITFLADRWFCNLKVMNFIQNQGHYFCFRAKTNSNIKIKVYDYKEKHKIYKNFSDLSIQQHHSLYYENIEVGTFGFHCNLSTARGKVSKDPWFILSNIEPNKAIREYSHRFGCIESMFKSQKSNGLNLERTKTKNIKAFETLYGICCFVTLWLTIIGADYTKNYCHKKKFINIKFAKKINNKTIRTISNFNLGLTLFRKAYNSYIDFKIKCNMQLYL